MPTYGYQGNCSSEVIEVSVMLNRKISSYMYMANYSASETLIDPGNVFRIKCMCNGTFGTSHVSSLIILCCIIVINLKI